MTSRVLFQIAEHRAAVVLGSNVQRFANDEPTPSAAENAYATFLLHPIPPEALMNVFKSGGWDVDEDAEHWIMISPHDPKDFFKFRKSGEEVDVDTMSTAQRKAAGTPLMKRLVEAVGRHMSSRP
jgi:hypothetical protein